MKFLGELNSQTIPNSKAPITVISSEADTASICHACGLCIRPGPPNKMETDRQCSPFTPTVLGTRAGLGFQTV